MRGENDNSLYAYMVFISEERGFFGFDEKVSIVIDGRRRLTEFYRFRDLGFRAQYC